MKNKKPIKNALLWLAIKQAGGAQAVADELGLSKTTMYNWRDNEIPLRVYSGPNPYTDDLVVMQKMIQVESVESGLPKFKIITKKMIIKDIEKRNTVNL